MTTNAFRHRPPEQCTLSKEDQQHILRISNNDQELHDELMAILRQLRPLPPRGASVRHTSRCDRCAQRLPGAISKIGEGSEHLVDREKPHCASPAITRCPDVDHGNDRLDDTRVYLRRGLLSTPGSHGHTVPDTTSWQTFLRINVTSSSVWVSFSISALVMTMRRIFLIRATEMR